MKLSSYNGKVLLIVNVASECGNTPQYAGLEEIYKEYQSQGFEILAFPCNDFGGQEPGTNEEIKTFCTTNYGVTFPLFDKVKILAPDKSPLYAVLTNNSVTAKGVTVLLSSCEWPDRQLQGVDPLQSSIPSAARLIDEELGNKLREIELYIAADWSGQRYPTAFGTELLVANINRGEILLTEQTFLTTVLTLDRLKALGVKAVTLDIQYPILLPPFPRSSDYLNFYRRVVSEIKKRNFICVIEIVTTLKDPLFNHLDVDYRGLTLERFKRELLDVARVIDGLGQCDLHATAAAGADRPLRPDRP